MRRAAAGILTAALLTPLASAANIPRPSPEFAINTAPGAKPVLLSNTRGKVVVMLFILTYCAHCQKTVEALTPLQKQYEARGFQVLTSAIEDMAVRAVPEFIKRYNPPFPVGYNDRNQVLDFLQLPMMNRLLMPQMALIDRKGVIRAQFGGEHEIFNDDVRGKLVKLIEPLLKESATRAPVKKAVPAKAPAAKGAVKKSS